MTTTQLNDMQMELRSILSGQSIWRELHENRIKNKTDKDLVLRNTTEMDFYNYFTGQRTLSDESRWSYYINNNDPFRMAIDEYCYALMVIDKYMNSPTMKRSKIIDEPIINKGDETKRRKQNTRRVIKRLNMRKNNTNKNRRN